MTLAKHLAVGSRYGKRGGWHLPTRRYEASTPQEWTISARLVQTCNLTYCPTVTFVTIAAAGKRRVSRLL